MGIGTSLGAYFDSEFHHSAGIKEPNDEMVKKPADTGDDNVLPPPDPVTEGGGNMSDLTPVASLQQKGLVDFYQAFRNIGKPYREQRDYGFPVKEPPPSEDTLKIHPISDLSEDPSNLHNHNTYLGPYRGQERIDYDAWEFNQSVRTGRLVGRDKHDYDLMGYWKEHGNVDLEPDTHLPDTYKKPNHPTFSNESNYHGTDDQNGGKFEGGEWGKDSKGKDTFTPGKTNFDYHTPQEMIDYFKEREPDSQLILPGQ